MKCHFSVALREASVSRLQVFLRPNKGIIMPCLMKSRGNFIRHFLVYIWYKAIHHHTQAGEGDSR